MNRSLSVVALILLALSIGQQFQLNTLQHQHKELLTQVIDLSTLVGQMGDELDNLETKLHIDKESVQD